ncbi:efflux transporter, RND family, MFP subunit [Candidatus Vecturithrix granuli]|uniref:Efflux transporter, RND family, MFP subunit n=1 Tax=Vecturithrix granuli TaxID=1499967 RepID=A0A081C1R9_VECG1|nr:efflux transporter, RND family, MFP subunit [Candidatus Vecturithrix granuli]
MQRRQATKSLEKSGYILKLRRIPWMILALIFLFMSIQGCQKEAVSEKQNDTVKLIKLYTVRDAANGTIRREYPGVTKASQRAELAFRVPGQLMEFSVKEGQHVHKGELLARLDQRDYTNVVKQASFALQAASAELKAMQSGRPEEIRQLQANVKATQAQLDEVTTRYKRYQQLFTEKVISKQQLDGVKAEYDVALSLLEAAEEKLKQAEQGARQEEIEAQQSKIRMLEAQLQDATSKLSDTELHAPFDGVVGKTFVENFENIQAKQPIVLLHALSQLEVVVSIPEVDVVSAGRLGASLQEVIDAILGEFVAVFPAYPDRTFPLTLKAYETDRDAATQTYQVTFTMEQPENMQIIAGMNVTVRGQINSQWLGEQSTILIPSSAVFADSSGQASVWLVDPEVQRVTLQPVELGLWHQDMIEILTGVNVGDTLAISAVQSLQNGMKVKQIPDLGEL